MCELWHESNFEKSLLHKLHKKANLACKKEKRVRPHERALLRVADAGLTIWNDLASSLFQMFSTCQLGLQPALCSAQKSAEFAF